MAIIKTEAALKVLQECKVEGNVVKLPTEQLPRELYAEVRKHLELIGGKWKGGKTYGFVFANCEPQYIQGLLEEQANGDGRNLKKEYQFFATPAELALKMVDRGPFILEENCRILEPSAGDGALIRAIVERHGETIVECCELMEINQVKLKKIPQARLMGADFLEWADAAPPLYDFIIANPPFTKNQDIDHIRKMYEVLKPGGCLVTLSSMSWTFGSQKKQVAFREWLKDINAVQEEIPVESFKESGTNVGAMLLVIEKEESANDTPFDAPTDRKCRKCGCTEDKACIDANGQPCYWVDEDLCSACLVNIKEIDPKKKGGIELGKELLEEKSQLKTSNKMKKIMLPASPLISVLKKVKEVIVKHSTLSVLSNILIKVRRTDIQIIASDLMVTIQGTIDIVNDGDYGYEYLLPFDFLYNIGNLINDLSLTIELETITKKVDGKKVDTVNAILTTYTDVFRQEDLDSTTDWPAMPEFPQENSIGIGGDFILWLNKAIPTASTDNTNQAMQKISISIENEGLAMASTNAHVVFEKTFQAESKHAASLLVNTKIAKALKGFKETSISWSDSHIAFVSNGITMIGTIQDEKFPNYRGVFPIDAPANLKLSLAELTGIMEKVSLTKKHAIIWLKREIGHIVVESFDEIYNRKVTVRIGADYSGSCEQIIINPENMLLLLKQVEYTTISLSITGPTSPIVITSESDPSYRALTMPMVL